MLGQDKGGIVGYADYANVSVRDSVIKSSIASLVDKINATSISFTNNELTNLYCDGDCLNQGYSTLSPTLYQPGGMSLLKQAILPESYYPSLEAIEVEAHNIHSLVQASAFREVVQ